MKGKIFKIKNAEDELVLPITTTEAVYSEDGKTLNDEIKNINSSLDNMKISSIELIVPETLECYSELDSSVAINQALQIGDIQLKGNKTYYISNTIVIPSYRKIYGNGATIKLNNNSNVDMIKNVDGAIHFCIYDLTLNGNNENQQEQKDGIKLTNAINTYKDGDTSATIQNVKIKEISGNGVHLTEFVRDCRFINVEVRNQVKNMGLHGFYSNLSSDCYFTNCISVGMNIDGFRDIGSKNMYVGCNTFWCNEIGYNFIRTSINNVTGCSAQESGKQGLYVDGVNNKIDMILQDNNRLEKNGVELSFGGYGNNINVTHSINSSMNGKSGYLLDTLSNSGFNTINATTYNYSGAYEKSVAIIKNNTNISNNITVNGKNFTNIDKMKFDIVNSINREVVDGFKMYSTSNLNVYGVAIRDDFNSQHYCFENNNPTSTQYLDYYKEIDVTNKSKISSMIMYSIGGYIMKDTEYVTPTIKLEFYNSSGSIIAEKSQVPNVIGGDTDRIKNATHYLSLDDFDIPSGTTKIKISFTLTITKYTAGIYIDIYDFKTSIK